MARMKASPSFVDGGEAFPHGRKPDDALVSVLDAIGDPGVTLVLAVGVCEFAGYRFEFGSLFRLKARLPETYRVRAPASAMVPGRCQAISQYMLGALTNCNKSLLRITSSQMAQKLNGKRPPRLEAARELYHAALFGIDSPHAAVREFAMALALRLKPLLRGTARTPRARAADMLEFAELADAALNARERLRKRSA